MPNYLTKEEIRQWRSSLEKITLEEFAARLGKSVEEKSHGLCHDLSIHICCLIQQKYLQPNLLVQKQLNLMLLSVL